jgi:hypothetical protein
VCGKLSSLAFSNLSFLALKGEKKHHHHHRHVCRVVCVCVKLEFFILFYLSRKQNSRHYYQPSEEEERSERRKLLTSDFERERERNLLQSLMWDIDIFICYRFKLLIGIASHTCGLYFKFLELLPLKNINCSVRAFGVVVVVVASAR